MVEKCFYDANAECLPLARTRHFTAEGMARPSEVHEPATDVFVIILRDFATLLCIINTPKLQTGAADVKCPDCIYRNGHHLCEIDWTLNSSAFCISKQKYETKAVDGHRAGSVHTCHPSEWIQSEICTPWFLCFLKHKNQHQCILSC